MKRKLLTILLLTTLSIPLISCEKKVVYTGDPDVDAEIQEMWEEEFSNTSYDDEDEDEDTKSSTEFKIKNSYLVSLNDINYVVLHIKLLSDFENNTKLCVNGVNNGEENELINYSIHYYLQTSNYDTANYSWLDIPFIYGENDNFLIFKTDWDGYDSYSIEVSTDNSSNKYEIDSNELQKFTSEDFEKLMFENMFNSIEETNSVKFGEYEAEFVSLISVPYNKSSGRLKFTLNIKNSSNLPTKHTDFDVSIFSQDGTCYKGSLNIIPNLTPNEEKTLDYSLITPPDFNCSPGDEFLMEIVYQLDSEKTEIKYLKFKI